jgi:rhodanese-related sulfurtransferase
MENGMRLGIVFACALVASASLSGVANAADTPASLNGAKSADAAAVAKAQSAGAVVVDTRVASEYADGHIKGAISVPYREKSEKSAGFDASQDEFNVAKLPADKGAAIVIYCNGPECWKSFKATTVSVKAGYTNILWYREGFPDWKSKNLPVATAE